MAVVGQVYRDGSWVTVERGQKAERYRARTKFRDSDGILREVERFAPTKGKAETRLKAALAERVAPTRGALLRPDMSIVDASAIWLAQVERNPDLADSTRRQYAAALERYVKGSTVAGLSLRELNRVPVLRGYLQSIADTKGPGASKTARSVLSSILTLAVRDGVLPHNAMRDVGAVGAHRGATATGRRTRDTSRALTPEERARFLDISRTHERAQALDVSDIALFMAGTGCRISEALAQLWEDVDLDAEEVTIRGTKTAHSVRTLALPGWLADELRRRAEGRARSGLVFPSPGQPERGASYVPDPTIPRDRRNVARVMRVMFDAAGLPWATPHSLRRTVATMIDAAGLPVALAADVLGHADASMTARVYLGRGGSTRAAAEVL